MSSRTSPEKVNLYKGVIPDIVANLFPRKQIPLDEISNLLGKNIRSDNPHKAVQELKKEGLIIKTKDYIQLTEQGVRDFVPKHLLVEAELDPLKLRNIVGYVSSLFCDFVCIAMKLTTSVFHF